MKVKHNSERIRKLCILIYKGRSHEECTKESPDIR
jgi:hypothetical protein